MECALLDGPGGLSNLLSRGLESGAYARNTRLPDVPRRGNWSCTIEPSRTDISHPLLIRFPPADQEAGDARPRPLCVSNLPAAGGRVMTRVLGSRHRDGLPALRLAGHAEDCLPPPPATGVPLVSQSGEVVPVFPELPDSWAIGQTGLSPAGDDELPIRS
jgi:hypothetical protein